MGLLSPSNPKDSKDSKEKQQMETISLHGVRYEVLSGSPELVKKVSDSIKDKTFEKNYDKNDNHMHTDLTDGILSPRRLIDLAVMKGMTNITITDHNTTHAAWEAKKYAEKKYHGKIKVNIGVELSVANGGHMILVNLPEGFTLNDSQPGKLTLAEFRKNKTLVSTGKIYSGMDMMECIKIIREEYPAVKIILPHIADGDKSTEKDLKGKGVTTPFGFLFTSKNAEKGEKTENLQEKIETEVKKGNILLEGRNRQSKISANVLGSFGMKYTAFKEAGEYAKENEKVYPFIGGSDTHVGDFDILNIVPKYDENGQPTEVFDQLLAGNRLVLRKIADISYEKEAEGIAKEKAPGGVMGFYEKIIKKLKRDLTGNDLAYYASRIPFFNRYFNEQKLDDKDLKDPTKMQEFMDSIGRKIRYHLFGAVTKKRIGEVLEYRVTSATTEEDKKKERENIKKIKERLERREKRREEKAKRDKKNKDVSGNQNIQDRRKLDISGNQNLEIKIKNIKEHISLLENEISTVNKQDEVSFKKRNPGLFEEYSSFVDRSTELKLQVFPLQERHIQNLKREIIEYKKEHIALLEKEVSNMNKESDITVSLKKEITELKAGLVIMQNKFDTIQVPKFINTQVPNKLEKAA